MSKDRNCLSCDNYKDEYCSVVDMKPYYPERGCDYFEARMSNIQEICDKVKDLSERVENIEKHPSWCPLLQISNEYYGRLIRFNDIQIITAPIAPIFKGDKVHYEGVAFLNQLLEIPPVKAIPVAAVEEMKRKIEEHNEFSRDEIDEMYMQDVLKIIDECCGIIEADKVESEK